MEFEQNGCTYRIFVLVEKCVLSLKKNWGEWALFRLLPPASLLVCHDGLNAIVMGGFE